MRKLPSFVLIVTMACSSAVLAQQSDATGNRVDDAALTARVEAALIDNEATRARQIEVETRNGVVQLSGFVDSEDMKRTALMTARSVRGVTQVRNGLIVREADSAAGKAVDDVVIVAKVKTELARKADLASGSDVNVEADNGIVQLSGFVATVEEKNRAADVASTVDGVKDVRNNIALEHRQ